MYLYLSVLILIVSFLYYYFTRTFHYWKDKNVKGPKPVPFFGNFKDVAARRQHIGMLYSDIYKQYPEEKVVGIFRMTAPCLLIRDLDIVKQILIKDFDAFPDRGSYFSKEGFTQNIFHSDADTWKVLRHRFSSLFTTSKFKSVFHLLDGGSDKFINYIESVIMKQSEQDIYQLFLKYSVASTMSTIFGMDINTYNDDINLFDEVDKYFGQTYDREIDMLFPGYLIKFNRSILTKETIKFCHQVVEAGMKQPDAKTDMHNIMDVLKSMKKEGHIHMTQPINKETDPFLEITDDLLAGQVWISYLAGYGNSSLSLTYAMYHLAQYPDVQEKLREEIDEILKKYDGKLNYEALKDMKYLEKVFEETLRMHPLTNAIQRRSCRNIKLEGVDLIVEKGTDIVISPYSIQHDEKHYPEPERFYPDRFSPENSTYRHPCAFLSFGAGRRSCLGSRLAQIQFGICVAKVVSKFRVETCKNTISSMKYDAWKMLITPEQRIRLRLVPRQM